MDGIEVNIVVCLENKKLSEHYTLEVMSPSVSVPGYNLNLQAHINYLMRLTQKVNDSGIVIMLGLLVTRVKKILTP